MKHLKFLFLLFLWVCYAKVSFIHQGQHQQFNPLQRVFISKTRSISQAPDPEPVPSPDPVPTPTPETPSFDPVPQPPPEPIPGPQPVEPTPLPSGPEPIPGPQEPSPVPQPVPGPEPIPGPQEPSPVPQPSGPEPVPGPQGPQPVPQPVPIPSPAPGPTPAPAPAVTPPPPIAPFENSCGVGNITETFLDGDIIDVVEVNATIVYIQTTTLSVYRTTDGGKTWTIQTPAPGRLVLQLIQSPADPFKIYFFIFRGSFIEYSYIVYTANGGQTYTIIPGNLPIIDDILPHPTNPNTLAIVFYDFYIDRACPLIPGAPHGVCFYVIFSFDSGFTWNTRSPQYRPLSFPTFVSWGPAGTSGEPNTLFIALMWDSNTDLTSIYKSTNYFGASQLVPPNFTDDVRGFIFLEELEGFLIISAPKDGDNRIFLVDQKFINSSQAVFPITDATNEIDSLVVADVTPGSIFLALHKVGEPEDELELFLSDSLGGQFTLSLNHLVVDENNIRNVDLFKVPGLEGIFLANHWSTELPRIQESVITFDKGFTWQTINAPPEELENCPGCTLQFYGLDFLYGYLYVDGDRESNGVLISNGVTSNSTDIDPIQGNIYISRDAGYSWTKLFNGTWYYDTSNTAGFIALTRWDIPTNKIVYTRDQGLSWSDCLYQQPNDTRNLTVQWIATNLTPQNRSLWIMSQWNNGVKNLYSLIHTDWNNNSIPICTANDYETFSPNGPDCILGKNITVRRRKQDVVCYVDPNEQTSIITPCPCTRADYHCSYCFAENTSLPNSPCMPILSDHCKGVTNPPKGSCLGVNGTKYPIYSYKKIEGTSCLGNIDELEKPIYYDCPPIPINITPPPEVDNNNGLKIGLPIGIIIVLILIAIIIFFLVKKRKEQQFATLNEEPRSEL